MSDLEWERIVTPPVVAVRITEENFDKIVELVAGDTPYPDHPHTLTMTVYGGSTAEVTIGDWVFPYQDSFWFVMHEDFDFLWRRG